MKKHILTFLISCISLMAVAQNGLVAVTPVTTVKDGELYIYTFSTKSYNTSIAYGTLKVTSTDLKIFSSLPSGSNNSISIRFSGNNITTPKTGTLTFTAKYINNGSTQEYDLPPLNISVTIHPPTVIPPVTRPVNDDYTGAVLLNPGNNTTCIQQVNGTTVNATQSAQSVPACAGGVNDDVWYKFVALSGIHSVNLSDITHQGPIAGGVNSIAMAIYTNDLIPVHCSFMENNITANGLIAGETYYVRVWTSLSVVNRNINFKICVTTPSLNVIRTILPAIRDINSKDQPMLITAEFIHDPAIPLSDITFDWQLANVETGEISSWGFSFYEPDRITPRGYSFLNTTNQVYFDALHPQAEDQINIKVRMKRISTGSYISEWYITSESFFSF